MKTNYKKQYRDIETKVLRELSDLVKNSSLESEHVESKALKINIEFYTELVIIDEHLNFLDANGYSYNIFNTCTLETLIDLIEFTKRIVKEFNIMQNIGSSKYLVNFHDGLKFHQDGSKFFDIAIFKSRAKLNTFTKGLKKQGYLEK